MSRAPLHPDHAVNHPRGSRFDGWTTLYTRGYSLDSPAPFAFRWMIDHAPFGSHPVPADADQFNEVLQREPRPIVRTVFPRRRLERVTEWEIVEETRIVYHDRVFDRGRLHVLGRERYEFHGGEGVGSIVEVTVDRKPVSLSARIGFLLAPGAAARSRKEEMEIFDAIDADFHRR
jgi:hypothetical protein